MFTFLLELPAFIFIFGEIGIAVAIFIICAVIDGIRIKLFKLIRIDILFQKVEMLFSKCFSLFIKADENSTLKNID